MGKRILVVEDDQELGDLLAYALASEGHDAVVARTVQQAILQGQQFITLDVAMRRGREGLEVIESCGRAGEPRPRVIVVTAVPSELRDTIRRNLRVAVVLSKPFDITELLALIDS